MNPLCLNCIYRVGKTHRHEFHSPYMNLSSHTYVLAIQKIFDNYFLFCDFLTFAQLQQFCGKPAAIQTCL